MAGTLRAEATLALQLCLVFLVLAASSPDRPPPGAVASAAECCPRQRYYALAVGLGAVDGDATNRCAARRVGLVRQLAARRSAGIDRTPESRTRRRAALAHPNGGCRARASIMGGLGDPIADHLEDNMDQLLRTPAGSPASVRSSSSRSGCP
jgi:hypothetical protein